MTTAMRPLDLVLNRLERLGPVRRSGKEHLARCPAHQDDTPSLGITENARGDALLRCRAGCPTEEIVAALGLAMRDLFADRAAGNGHAPRRVVAKTDYPDRDTAGVLQAIHRRFDCSDGTKAVIWYQPDGCTTGLLGRRLETLPLYGSEHLRDRPGEPVILVEGEKAAQAILDAGGLGLGTVTGADGVPSDEVLGVLRERVVYPWPDNDDIGRQHMQRVAAALDRLGIEYRVIRWIEAPMRGADAYDYLAAGGDLDALLAGATAPDEERAAADDPDDEAPGARAGAPPGAIGDDAEADDKRHGQRVSQADLLVALAADATLWHAPDGKPYASMAVGGHVEHWPLQQKGFRDWLAHRFYRAHEKAPGGQALQDALNVLAGRARFDGEEHPVYVRVAERDGALYLDLGDAEWAAVQVDATGWRVVAEPPVRFARPRGLAPLPRPEPGGALDALRPFLNHGTEATWRLIVAWLVAACRPGLPLPVLVLNGEQGSAKSTAGRVLGALLDPRQPALRSWPRNERDLAIAARHAWLLMLDNLSTLPDWLSDGLCRLATGGGLGTRELYSDDEEVLFDALRPVLLNGIPQLATAPDLLDRAIICELPPIPEGRRRAEADFWRDFERARPAILGALYTAVAGALARLPDTALPALPRMADFALWATAAEPALGWPPGAFLATYRANRAEGSDQALDASPVAQAVRTLTAKHPAGAPWEGTAGELLAALAPLAGEAATKSREWPKTARGLAGELRRFAPALRAAGVAVAYRREAGGQRRRLVALHQDMPAADRPDRPDRPAASASAGTRGTVGGAVRDDGGPLGADREAPSSPPAGGDSPRQGAETSHGRDAGDGRDGRERPSSEGAHGDGRPVGSAGGRRERVVL